MQRGRHKKQSGGHGQYGDVVLDIKPLPRGSGFTFTEEIKGGVVPRNYIPSVEEGVADALKHGPLGFPVVDITAKLVDGSYHTVDSSDMAFQLAGRLAIHEGLPQCQPVLLEPIYQVEIVCPSEATAKMNALMSGRRGQILGFDTREGWDGWDVVRVQMPESEIGDLIVEVRSATAGVGSFTFKFDHMAELVGRTADQIVAARKCGSGLGGRPDDHRARTGQLVPSSAPAEASVRDIRRRWARAACYKRRMELFRSRRRRVDLPARRFRQGGDRSRPADCRDGSARDRDDAGAGRFAPGRAVAPHQCLAGDWVPSWHRWCGGCGRCCSAFASAPGSAADFSPPMTGRGRPWDWGRCSRSTAFLASPRSSSSCRAWLEPWLSPLIGVATGLVTAATGVYMIPSVPYLQAIGLEKDELVQALGLSFTVSTLALAATLVQAGALQMSIAGARCLRSHRR